MTEMTKEQWIKMLNVIIKTNNRQLNNIKNPTEYNKGYYEGNSDLADTLIKMLED